MATSERNKSDSVDTGRSDPRVESSDVEEPNSHASAKESRAEEIRDSTRDRNEEYGEVY